MTVERLIATGSRFQSPSCRGGFCIHVFQISPKRDEVIAVSIPFLSGRLLHRGANGSARVHPDPVLFQSPSCRGGFCIGLIFVTPGCTEQGFQSPSCRGGFCIRARRQKIQHVGVGFNPLPVGAASASEVEARNHNEAISSFNPLPVGAASASGHTSLFIWRHSALNSFNPLPVGAASASGQDLPDVVRIFLGFQSPSCRGGFCINPEYYIES